MNSGMNYKYVSSRIYTVAVYGSRGPYLFGGHLTMKRYYRDKELTDPDPQKTSAYLADNLYYEVNKVLRMQNLEEYSENRNLAVRSYVLLSDPYRLVYNLNAAGSFRENNLLDLLTGQDPQARGTAIVMKQNPDGTLSGLTLEEAREVQNSLGALL